MEKYKGRPSKLGGRKNYSHKPIKTPDKAEDYCGKKRPNRKVLCQLKKGHKGSHRAIIFWEDK